MKSSVAKLLSMSLLHFLVMFVLTYSMVYTADHLFFNINKLYMSGLMTAPMIIIEILIMKGMYQEEKKAASIVFAGSVMVLVMLFLFIRNQVAVGEQQFLKSMIPHHSSAILMCEKANLTDPEIEQLCTEIIETQKREIEIMEQKLGESS